MEDKTQKERLEQELRFLKESFDAEVISKEEFEKGKDRIDKKLQEIEKEAKQQSSEAQKIEEKSKEEKIENDKPAEAKTEEKIKLKVIQNESEEDGHFEPASIKADAREKLEEHISGEREEKKDGKFFKYAVVFVILILVIFFSYFLLKEGSLTSQEKISQVKFVAACSANEDCQLEGKEGICISPETKDAKCEFKDVPRINVIVLNDRKNCFNCDTQRVLTILEEWFGAVNSKEINYSTDEGKNLAGEFNARALPMYILDENITKKPKFEQLKKTFIKKDNNYILSGDAAGSTFYFNRDSIPSKLDLFVKENESASVNAEKNLKEFLENFKEAKFEKHLSDGTLTKELGIKSFPTFLINNRIKFSGVHPAETIKENFCKLNKLPVCEKSLSKNLI